MHDTHRRSQTRRAPRSRLTRKQGPSGVSPERDCDRAGWIRNPSQAARRMRAPGRKRGAQHPHGRENGGLVRAVCGIWPEGVRGRPGSSGPPARAGFARCAVALLVRLDGFGPIGAA
jgi:hypothetical protein